MKMRIFALCCLLLMLVLPVAAAGKTVNDGADLLTSEEERKLDEILSDCAQRTGIEVAVVTADSTDGEAVEDFAANTYLLGGYGDDGVMLLVSMEDRDYYILTAGKGEDLLTYGELGRLEDGFLDMLSDGAYFDAFSAFAAGVEKYAAMEYKSPVGFVVCIVIGIAIGFAVVLILKGQLQSVRSSRSAANYVVSGSFQLTKSNDFFLFRNVTRMEKPSAKTGASGGGGRSFGGRGGKF